LYYIYESLYNIKNTYVIVISAKKILKRKKQMFLNQGTSQPEASQQEVNGDMASSELEELVELVELDEVQLATVVGGLDWEFLSKRWKEQSEFDLELALDRQHYIIHRHTGW